MRDDASIVKPVKVELTIEAPTLGIRLTATWTPGQLTYNGSANAVRTCPPGTIVSLKISFGSSNQTPLALEWRAEELASGLVQTVGSYQCDIQFTQRCFLSPRGVASWRLQLNKSVDPPLWAVTYQRNFTSPNTPVQLEPLLLQAGVLSTQMRYDILGQPENDREDLNFICPFKALVFAECSFAPDSELRYRAKLPEKSTTFKLGNGLTISQAGYEIWQKTAYDYTVGLRTCNLGFDKITTENILSSWTLNLVRRFYDGLSVDHDFTLLPELTAIAGSAPVPWSVVLEVTDETPLFTNPDAWEWLALDDAGEYQSSLTPVDIKGFVQTRVLSIRISSNQSVLVSALMRMFRTENGTPTVISVLSLTTPPGGVPGGSVWGFALSGRGWDQASNQVIRAGAFELYLPSSNPAAATYTILCGVDFGITTPQKEPSPIMPLVRCTVPMLPLFDVAPAGEDDLDHDRYTLLDATSSSKGVLGLNSTLQDLLRSIETEISSNMHREGALVFRNPADGSKLRDGNWTLEYNEQSSSSLKRIVTMLLRFTAAPSVGGTPPNDESVLVIDRLPFAFAEIHFNPLTDTSADVGGTIVAAWNKQLNTWKIAKIKNSPSYLVLPSQTVGEEFVTDENNYPRGIGPGTHNLPQLTLGTPAIATMGANDKLNYTDVPWNLRRLVTDNSLDVERFDSEMLYGLACSTVAPHMRLTEAETLYGRLRGPLPTLPTALPTPDYDWKYLNARLHWSRIYREYQSRLGVYVLADATQPDQERFLDSKNTLCDLRLSSSTMPKDDSGKMKPYWSPSRLSPVFRDPKRFKGGALEGIENSEIFKQVVSAVRSDAGSTAIIDPRVSALGGFGTIRAGFGNSKLINSISTGRTMTYTVERLGRIGAHWNRAKHVIVYQRTVFPSRQFFNEQKPNSAFPGYPLVRKVEEYVEFLEPERVFSEEPAGAQTSFLKAFKCGDRKRYAVNSSWGSTVPGEGLTIPLWNAAAATQLPDVYPQPQFYLQVSTPEPALDSTGTELKFITQDSLLLHPAEVVFYTSTREKSTDTDTWAAVQGVDYVTYPMIIPDASLYDNGELDNQPLPEFDAPPGWEPVTFTIKPPATGVHSTDGIVKTTKPMGARVKKVTVSRGAVARPITVANLLAGDQGSLNTYSARALELAGVKLGLATAQKLVAAQLAKVTQDVNEVNATVAQVQDHLQKAQAGCNGLSKNLKDATDGLSARVTKPFTDAADALKVSVAARGAPVSRQLNTLSANIARLLAPIQTGFDYAQADVVRANHVLQVIAATVHEDLYWPQNELKDRLDAALRSWSVAIEEVCGTYSPLRPVAAALAESVVLMRALTDALTKMLAQDASSILAASRILTVQFDTLVAAVRRALTGLQAHVPQLDPTLVLLILNTDGMAEKFHSLEQAAESALNIGSPVADLRQAVQSIANDVQQISTTLTNLSAAVPEATFDLLRQSAPIVALYAYTIPPNNLDQLRQAISQIKAAPLTLVNDLSSQCVTWLQAMAQATHDALAALAQQIANLLAAQGAPLATEFGALQGKLVSLAGAFGGALPDIKGLQAQLDGYARGVQGTIQSAQQSLDQYVREPLMRAYQPLAAGADNVLRTVRALGEPPQVPQLDISPPLVAYIYDYADSKVPITPVLARAHQVDQALNALGIALPAVHLGEVLIPSRSPNFDLNRILPNFSGLKLAGLFSGIKLPPIDPKQIALTHDWEPQLRRGWLQADVNLPLAKHMVVFQSDFISFSLREATFTARSRVATQDGHIQQSTDGSITGTWSIEIGESSSLIDFAETSLTFNDSGKLHFNFSPSKLRLSDALKAVTSLIQVFSDPQSGFTYGATPKGVKCAFALPVPDTAALTSGFTGLKFSTSLELDFSQGFVIRLGVGVSSKDQPFNFAVFILGGCGYLQAGVTYNVEQKTFSRSLEMAIGCSGGLAIAFGPISGSIYAQFAIELRVANRGFSTGAFFQITGHVSILGIVSVDLVFRLEASYSAGVMTASGHFSIEIKLFMFSLQVSRDVSMHLGSGGQSRLDGGIPPGNELAALSDGTGIVPGLADAFAASENWAQHYVDMLI